MSKKKKIVDEKLYLSLQLQHAERSAKMLAWTIQDLFNDIGEVEEVRKAYEAVYSTVSEWSGSDV